MSAVVTTNTRLNVRGGAPTTSAPIVARVEIGSHLPIVGITSGDPIENDARWYAGVNNTFFWAGACSSPDTSAVAATNGTAGVLSGRLEHAPAGTMGFDVDSPLSASMAQSRVQQGFKFCIRYLTRAHDQPSPGDLSRQEAEAILSAGLGLMAVQHVSAGIWIPTETLGETYGQNAVANAKAIGLPPGVNVFLDLESVRADTPKQDIMGYCNAWLTAVEAAGYETGLYVGVDAQLTGDELYWDIKTKHYWRAGSRSVPEITQRGYQLIQKIPAEDTVNSIDTNSAQTDAFGDSVVWLTRA